jgi:hypothetical protein
MQNDPLGGSAEETSRTEFCVPIQGVYEPMLPESATERYQLVVDLEYYSVRRARQITKETSYANLNEMTAVDIAK